MRGGYHIRISLEKQAASTSASTSTSYNQRSGSISDQFVPTSLFEPLPSHPPRTTARRNTVHHPNQGPESSRDIGKSPERLDFRLGPLRVDWVDFEEPLPMESPVTKKNTVGKEREGKARGGPATASFIPSRSKSGSTNLPEGIVHIYREPPTSTYAKAASGSASPPLPPPVAIPGKSTESAEPDGVLMGVLAVPSWMTPSDFLTFVAPAAEGMAHLRMIRDSAPNRSLVVINFRNEADATEFAEAYNGKAFNSMEPEICHVVRILSVTIDEAESAGQSVTQLGLPGTSYELPTCPVCLERMDSALTGLVTVPCSHTFHCTCLSKWGDSRCPVCRYSQTLLSSHPSSANSRSSVPIPFSTPPSSQCVDCPPDSPSISNLWICLICGNIGCGRYGRAHAQAHYQRTTHLYALELETQRVWDYAGDGYVHRLIQNKADGKLVELPSAASALTMGASGRSDGGGPSAADALSAEKIEAIGIEYSYLLTSQLDSQRTFYEEQTTELRTQLTELRNIVETLKTEVDGAKHRAKDQEDKLKKEEEERIAEIDRARIKAEKRAEKANGLARALENELKSERALSQGLVKNLTALKERAEKMQGEKEELNCKVTELEDQVRDIMFFVEARGKLQETEAAGGSLEVSTPPPAKDKKKKGKNR